MQRASMLRRLFVALVLLFAFLVARTAGAEENKAPSIDLYNALNANSILSLNTRYGSAWLRPIQILDGRIVKFGGQLTF